jgi:metal-responsive CopG/Arc/MetJ family transcriptional regulator
MPKKVIQVPIDEELLRALDRVSRDRHASRSEVIREACRRYLRAVRQDKLDRVYEEGYRRAPESPSLGETQAALASSVLEPEDW